MNYEKSGTFLLDDVYATAYKPRSMSVLRGADMFFVGASRPQATRNAFGDKGSGKRNPNENLLTKARRGGEEVDTDRR
ncbi:MAG: hypothetical protein MnENMB40S_35330 [Rhizobiaceae bacterium MnEN-MB40S]|nr:MAG: hypothetical protein MnENMB40S_35330 [Rhizobiaceae bacterium MnEN-MB40S]